jgi:hypothetical protein
MVIARMAADPEPDHIIIVTDGNGSVTIVDPRRPITSHLFEMQ